MMNKEEINAHLKYYVENNELYIKSFFMGNKISDVKVGSVEGLLHKVKMYDEEYKNLLNEIEHMKSISKDYVDLQQRIDKAIEYINFVAIATNKPKFFEKIKDTIWGEELLEILGGKE